MALIYLYFLLAVLIGIVATIRGRSWWRWFLISLFITPLIGGLLVMVLPREPAGYALSDYQGEPRSADCLLRIIRLSDYSERLRPYDIYMNGMLVGTVARNRVADFRVPSGTHVIEIRTGRVGSRPLMVETSPDHSVEIEVWNRGGTLRAIWAATLGSDEFLTIRQRPMGLPVQIPT
ncbi:MAG: hypothetical protein ACRDQZ_17695 [Mycobacteriales bacterium]